MSTLAGMPYITFNFNCRIKVTWWELTSTLDKYENGEVGDPITLGCNTTNREHMDTFNSMDALKEWFNTHILAPKNSNNWYFDQNNIINCQWHSDYSGKPLNSEEIREWRAGDRVAYSTQLSLALVFTYQHFPSPEQMKNLVGE